ncbi:hypothetical protein VTH06DRAFT_3799 [Thermothelomyces fergusii]
MSPISAPAQSDAGTPAVTPPSSSISCASGHSPTASSAGLSPSSSSRHSSTSVSYPTLPSRPNLPYPSSAGLGSTFAHNEQRRLSGGMLQSASGLRRDGGGGGGNRTPTTTTTPRAPDGANVSSPSDGSEGGGDNETYDEWLHNVRAVEFLRNYVRQRLERRDYESDSDDGRVDNSRIDPALVDRSRDRVNYPSLPPA